MEKDIIDGEAKVVKSEEKKEGKVSVFFKKAKEKISDAAYDTKMRSNYNKNHTEYTVYKGSSAFSLSISLYATEFDSYIVAPYDNEEIKTDYIIKNTKTNDVYYIKSVEETTLNVNFENKDNTLKAVKITFGNKAEKVDVIKVGDEYYLKK